MKKFSVIFALMTLVFQFIFFIPKAGAVDSVLGPHCTLTDDSRAYVISPDNFFTQSFKPTFDRITKFTIRLSGHESLQVGLTKNVSSNSNDLWSGSLTTSGDYPATYTLTFNPVTVTPGTTYYLFAAYGGPSVSWTQPGEECYTDGRAYVNGAPTYYDDFVFGIYGYNSADANQTEQSTDTTGNSTGTTGSAPTVNTAFRAPTSVKAEFIAATPAAKISWTKSATTDITGYRIYRSESKTTGFTKVGEVTKTIAEYSDTTISPSKTYYYYVRSYKANEESASSETVTLVTPAFAASAVTPPALKNDVVQVYTIDTKVDPKIYYLGIIAGVIFLFLLAYQIYLRRKGINGFRSFRLTSKPKLDNPVNQI